MPSKKGPSPPPEEALIQVSGPFEMPVELQGLSWVGRGESSVTDILCPAPQGDFCPKFLAGLSEQRETRVFLPRGALCTTRNRHIKKPTLANEYFHSRVRQERGGERTWETFKRHSPPSSHYFRGGKRRKRLPPFPTLKKLFRAKIQQPLRRA